MANANLKPLILHAHGTGPNPFKVAIALEVLSLPYTVKLWEFGPDPKNGVKGAAFTAINPNGRVPALEDPNTGVTSWESGACLNYLIRTYESASAGAGGKKRLGPGPSAQDAANYDAWTFWLVSTLGPMMGQVNWFRNYHSSKNDDALARYVGQAETYLGVLERQLERSGGRTVLPGGFSAVDCHVYPWIAIAGVAQLDLTNFPKVRSWAEGIKGLDEVKRAYEKVPKGVKAGQSHL